MWEVCGYHVAWEHNLEVPERLSHDVVFGNDVKALGANASLSSGLSGCLMLV